jgi:hypothetical protein
LHQLHTWACDVCAPCRSGKSRLCQVKYVWSHCLATAQVPVLTLQGQKWISSYPEPGRYLKLRNLRTYDSKPRGNGTACKVAPYYLNGSIQLMIISCLVNSQTEFLISWWMFSRQWFRSKAISNLWFNHLEHMAPLVSVEGERAGRSGRSLWSNLPRTSFSLTSTQPCGHP